MLLITLLFKPEALMSFLRDYRIQSRMTIAVPALLLGQGVMNLAFAPSWNTCARPVCDNLSQTASAFTKSATVAKAALADAVVRVGIA